MAVNSVKIEFVFDDKFSGPLKNAAGNLNGMNRALSNMGSTAALGNISKQVSVVNTGLNVAYGTLTKFSSAWKALGTLANSWNAMFGGIFEYAKAFETNAIGISGILASMTTLNGKQMEWNQSLDISKDIMKQLRVAALQTAATSTDLIDTFRGLLGPGLGAGMKINEIIEFTKVGVNAVKSMGLPSNQFLQELRGLEQGGIRASSSTLATALGLKDEDIKKARASSEGLFKFLMDRLKGFAQATDATAGTMAGQFEILKEALMGIGAEAGDSLFKSYSNTLGKINEILLTKNPITGVFEINPEVIERIKVAADFLDNLIGKVVGLGKAIANDATFYTGIFLAMTGLPRVFDAISNAAMGFSNRIGNIFTIMSQTRNVAKELSEQYRVTTLSAISEKEKEMRATIAINSEHERTNKILTEISKKLGIDMSKAAADLNQKMIALGLSEKEAAAKINQYLGYIKNGSVEQRNFAGALEVTVEKLYQEKQAVDKAAQSWAGFTKASTIMKNLVGATSQLSGALSGAAMALTVVTGAQDGWVKTMSDSLFLADSAITAVGGLSNALSTLSTWWTTAGLAAKAAMASMAVGMTVLALAAYKASQDIAAYQKHGIEAFAIDGEEVVRRSDDEIRASRLGGQSAATDAAMLQEQAAFDAAVAKQKERDRQKNSNQFGGIGLLYPRQEEDKKAQKAAEKAARELKQATKQYEALENTLNVSIAKSSNHYSALQEKNAAILKQDEAWTQKIREMAEKGVETAKINELTQLKDKAIKEQYLAAERDFNQKLNDLRLDSAKNTMLFGGSQEDQYNAVDEALHAKKFMLEMMLSDENLAADERIKIEQRYADTVKQIRDNSMYDYKTAWSATLEELSQKQINYGESIKSVFSSIESAGTNLLTSTESFGTRIKNFFSDIASSIIAEMSKMIIKGLITKAILSVFNFGDKSIGSTSFKTAMSGSSIDLGQTSAGYGLEGSLIGGHFAKGGLANGWSIVGEQGPELVNFSQPGRVYTAEQTRNALGGAGNVNIKIDLRNESGQQLQAEQTGSQFDGESYVIGVVLKAMTNNTNGMRSIVKGLASAQ